MGLVLTSFTLGGCASMGVPSNFSYQPPALLEIANEIDVDAESGEVWDDLVEQLATTFYVINNIDKESRLLNVSYSESNQPSLYVDCGTTRRDYEYRGKVTNYNYDTADSSVYKYTGGAAADMFVGVMERSTSLEGRANIYVAPNAQGGTTVTVNTRYIWSVDTTYTEMITTDGESLAVRYGFIPQKDSSQIAFNTGRIGVERLPDGSDGVSCVATGKFESEILDILRKTAATATAITETS